mgnify:CR=1 FL=1
MKQNLKNLNNKTYFEIKTYLKSNKIDAKSELSDSDQFYNISSIEKAGKHDLTFFIGKNSIENLKKTNAKGCLINSADIKYLPINTRAIIVNDVHKSFSLLSNFFNYANYDKCSGIISDKSDINKNSKIIGKVQIDPFVCIKENCLINNNVIELKHHTGEKILTTGPVLDFNHKIKQKSSPKLGENNKEILSFLGYKESTINKYRKNKTIL